MIIWSRNCPYVVFLQWNKNNDLPLNGNLVFSLFWLQEKRYLNRTPDLKENKNNWREEIVLLRGNHDVKLRIWRNREWEMKYEIMLKLSTFLTLFTRAGILKSVYLKIYKAEKQTERLWFLMFVQRAAREKKYVGVGKHATKTNTRWPHLFITFFAASYSWLSIVPSLKRYGNYWRPFQGNV